MFSNRLEKAFNSRKDYEGGINQVDLESILNNDFGYTFNRHFINELYKKYTNSDGREVSVMGSTETTFESGKRTKYLKAAVSQILIYIMIGETIKGLSKGNVKANHREILGCAFIGSVLNLSLGQHIYKYDNHAKIIAQELPAPLQLLEYPQGYSPEQHRDTPIALSDRVTAAYFFLSCWIDGPVYPDKFKFHRDWRIFRNRILLEDPVSEDDNAHTPKPFKPNVRFEFPMINKYYQRRSWTPEVGCIVPVGKQLTNVNRASLAGSITTLDAFIKGADAESVLALQDWMEVILAFENGSGWVIEEAQAELKESAPKLDQQRLIDDWWLLSFLYLRTIQKNTAR